MKKARERYASIKGRELHPLLRRDRHRWFSVERSQLVAASVSLPSHEGAEFFDEDSPGWFIREKKMIGTRQRNKPRVRNLCSQDSTLVGRHRAVTIAAVVVFEKIGVGILRNAWFNLDLVWASTLLGTGLIGAFVS